MEELRENNAGEAQRSGVREDAPSRTPVICNRFDDLGADGAPRRLGIMGGTFDPIHIGHLACAEQAREAFGLDAVVFIPTGNPAFKRDRAVTSGADRLAMCALAVRPNPHFDVSDMEIARGGVTYTVDTVRALRAHYPANVELFFISGADSILSIVRWRESAEIASMVHFIAVTRPGYAVSSEFKRELASLGAYDVSYLEVTALAVSSSDLRARVYDGYSLRYLTTLSVCDYIYKHGLYRGEGARPLATRAQGVIKEGEAVGAKDAGDALSESFFEARHAELAERVSEKRLRHIEGVVSTARDLAQAYGVDVRRARLAALLHDWDKGYDDEGILQRAHDLGMEIAPEYAAMPRVLHGMTAAVALAREFPEIPDDVICAVDRHTVGAVDMSELDMVVYIADAIEPGRTYGVVDELRAQVGVVSLEDLFFLTYRHLMSLMMERNTTMAPDTIDVWNEYAMRYRARHPHKKKGRK